MSPSRGETTARRHVLAADRWSEEARARLDALGAHSVDVEDRSLEDIFVAHVRKAPVGVS